LRWEEQREGIQRSQFNQICRDPRGEQTRQHHVRRVEVNHQLARRKAIM
jgi:hypothetical protein